MAETLGVGILGYGVFGEISADQYASISGLRIVAVADNDPGRQHAAAQRFEARGYANITSLLADPAVDIVVINTPPWLHGPQALQAAQAGKHLFVEKPLATSIPEAQAILQVVQDRGLQVSVDYVMRHVPLYTTLRALVQSDILGAVTYMALENHASNEALHANHWFWDRAKSGGIFVEHGVHFFDLCNQLSGGAAANVTGFAHTGADGRQDRVLASVQYANGVMGTFYHGFDRRAILERTRLRVTLERGMVQAFGWIPERLEIEGIVPDGRTEELSHILGVAVQPVTMPAPPGVPGGTPGTVATATLTRPDRTADYAAAIRAGMADLVRAIREPGFSPQVTPADGYTSLALALAAQESINDGTMHHL